jgi:hypothetical protein
VGLGYQLMQLTASGHPSQQDKSIIYWSKKNSGENSGTAVFKNSGTAVLTKQRPTLIKINKTLFIIWGFFGGKKIIISFCMTTYDYYCKIDFLRKFTIKYHITDRLES